MKMCNFTAPYFGASYPDACCINGLLWDLDSCDEPGGGLTSGGDHACPQCNHEAFMVDVVDGKEEEGYCEGWDRNPRAYTHRTLHCEQPGDEERCRAAWLRGYDKGAADLDKPSNTH